MITNTPYKTSKRLFESLLSLRFLPVSIDPILESLRSEPRPGYALHTLQTTSAVMLISLVATLETLSLS